MSKKFSKANYIKIILLLLPVIISFLLISAHFYRKGNILFTIIPLCIPIVLFFKSKVSIYIVQAGLFAGIAIWIQTFLFLKKLYDRYQMPFNKAGAILTAVILFTFLSALILKLKIFKEVYDKK